MLTTKQIAAIITSEVGTPASYVADSIETAAQKIHDLCKPDHTIHVAAAALENEVTSTLLDMVVATVLAKLIDQEGGGRTNFSFSPMDMAAVMKEWGYTVEHDGMVRTVRIQPLDTAEWEEGDGALLQHSSLARAMSRASMDDEIAPPVDPEANIVQYPQAEPHEYKRPVWVVRYNPIEDAEFPAMDIAKDQADAQRLARGYYSAEAMARVENRWCDHVECPSTGCNLDASKRDGAEATSDE